MEYSPNCAIPYVARVDAGTVELIRAVGRRRGVVRRSRPAVRSRLGRRRHRDAPARRPRSCTASRTGRSRPIARAAARRRADDRVRHSAADGGLVRGRRARQRLGADRVGAGERRQPALPADRVDASRRSAPTSSCCSTSGASSIGRARCLPTSPGSATPAARARAVRAGVRGGRAARATRRSRWCRTRRAPAASCAAGEVDRAASPVLRDAGYGDHILHRTGHSLGEIGARQRREHGRLRNPRRPAPAARHRALRSNRASTSTTSASASEINMIVRAARRGGHRTAADRDSGTRVDGGDRCPPARPRCSMPLLIAVASLAVGMVIASRLDLTPASSAQTHRRAADEQRAAHRRARRADRSATSPRRSTPMVVNIRTEMKAKAQDLDDFFGGGGGGGGDDFFHRFFGSPGQQDDDQAPAPQRPRQRRPQAARADDAAPPAPASSSARTASSSPTTTWSKTRPRSRSRSTAKTTIRLSRPS